MSADALFGEDGHLQVSTYVLRFDGVVLTISVPATPDGREMAEAWLAKWNRLLTPRQLDSSHYQLQVMHPRTP